MFTLRRIKDDLSIYKKLLVDNGVTITGKPIPLVIRGDSNTPIEANSDGATIGFFVGNLYVSYLGGTQTSIDLAVNAGCLNVATRIIRFSLADTKNAVFVAGDSISTAMAPGSNFAFQFIGWYIPINYIL